MGHIHMVYKSNKIGFFSLKEFISMVKRNRTPENYSKTGFERKHEKTKENTKEYRP